VAPKSSIPAKLWEQVEEVYDNYGRGIQAVRRGLAIIENSGYAISDGGFRGHMNRRGKFQRDLELVEEMRLRSDYLSERAIHFTYAPNATLQQVRDLALEEGIEFTGGNASRGGLTPALAIPPEDLDCEVRLVVTGDEQLPEYDWRLHGPLLDFMHDFLGKHTDGHGHYVNLGDLMSMNRFGRFRNEVNAPDIDEEYELARRVLRDRREAIGGCPMQLILGNHENRQYDRIKEHPSLGKLVPDIRELLGGDTVNLDHILPYTGGVIEFAGRLLIEHGERFSSKGGYTAAAVMRDRGKSTIQGHTHRLAAVAHRFYHGQEWGFENGTLANDQAYAHAPDWQQGFTYFRFFGDRMWFQQVNIINGQFWAEGRFYGSHTYEVPL
jgi:hypothetical protein